MIAGRTEIGTPLRVTVVMTHPVQYMSPWFRHMAQRRGDLDLTVLYAAIPDAEQQGVGFGRRFEWDVPLTEGYRFEVCADGQGKRFDSDSFFGLDVRDIGRHIEQTAPEVVVVPGWHAAVQVRALRACRRAAIPAVYRGDSTLFSGPRGVMRPVWEVKTRLMLGQYSAYLSVGRHATEYLRHFGVRESLIARSPHCVDNDLFASSAARHRQPDRRAALREAVGAGPGEFVVLFAGKFVPRKRPVDAVRAVAALGGQAVLILAGDGPLVDDTRAEATRLGVRHAWRGFLNQSELPAAFAAADSLIVPSAWESWGLIVNEALASGLPCVVTNGVAAAPDLIIDGITGYTTRAGDVDAMAERLRDVRTALDAGRDFAAACQARAATCDFDTASDGLVAAARAAATRQRAGEVVNG